MRAYLCKLSKGHGLWGAGRKSWAMGSVFLSHFMEPCCFSPKILVNSNKNFGKLIKIKKVRYFNENFMVEDLKYGSSFSFKVFLLKKWKMEAKNEVPRGVKNGKKEGV